MGSGTLRALGHYGLRDTTGSGTLRAPGYYGLRYTTGSGTLRALGHYGLRDNSLIIYHMVQAYYPCKPRFLGEYIKITQYVHQPVQMSCKRK